MIAWLLTEAVSLAGGAAPRFDAPEATIATSLGRSELADGEVEQTCRVYRTFAVLDTKDPGLRGSPAVTIRRRAPGTTPEALCAAGASDVRLPPVDGYFDGVVGDRVFLRGADGNAFAVAFWVFAADTGRLLLEGASDIERPMTFARTGATVGVRYQAAWTSDCPLAKDPSCWEKIRTEHGLPSDLAPPDCGPGFRAASSPADNSVVLSVPASIADLSRPVVTYERGTTRCAPSH